MDGVYGLKWIRNRLTQLQSDLLSKLVSSITSHSLWNYEPTQNYLYIANSLFELVWTVNCDNFFFLNVLIEMVKFDRFIIGVFFKTVWIDFAMVLGWFNQNMLDRFRFNQPIF